MNHKLLLEVEGKSNLAYIVDVDYIEQRSLPDEIVNSGDILMCKDIPVYDIKKNKVLNQNLLPGKMSKKPCQETFKKWMKARYSCGSNTFSRKLRYKMFSSQGHREEINQYSHALSFTDCYWIKGADEEILFRDVSPYFTSFWSGETDYEKGYAVPSLYVSGALPKYWKKDGTLFKEGKNLSIEIACIELCKLCEVPVENGWFVKNEIEEGIILVNLTNSETMLEQANMSCEISEDLFTEEDIVRVFGLPGIKMLTIDAIIGNGDRHAGNFGFLRNANTGEYISMCPLYDFDHALDARSVDHVDALMEALLSFFEVKEYKETIRDICSKAMKSNNNIFAKRARLILALVEAYDELKE